MQGALEHVVDMVLCTGRDKKGFLERPLRAGYGGTEMGQIIGEGIASRLGEKNVQRSSLTLF